MKPVKTASSNHNFGPPQNVADGSIGDLPCQIVEEHGYREIVSVWELSSVEREAVAAGYNLRLGVGWIGGMPPVALGVTHEQAIGTPLPRALELSPRADGVALIEEERRRQLFVEGWTDEHDDECHDGGQLARAAAVYACPPDARGEARIDGNPPLWPWRDFYKPTPDDRIRELVKAGALIAAEIDRLQRAVAREVV